MNFVRIYVALTKPVVDPKVGEAVQEHDLSCAHDLNGIPETEAHSNQTEIRNQDSQALRGEKDGREWRIVAEVGSGAGILGERKTLVAGRGVEEHVCLPANQLMSDKKDQADNRGVFSHVEEVLDFLLDSGHDLRVLLSGGNECGVLFHVVCVSVVASMRILPREVRNAQETVQNESEGVVDSAVVEHGLVATFVSQNPDTDKNETLEDAVESPQSAPQSEERYVLDLSSHVKNCEDQCNIACNVA